LPAYLLPSLSSVTGPIGLEIRDWIGSALPVSINDMPSPPIILFIGRLVYSKGIKQFVEVAKKVKSTNPDCRFIVLGGLESGFDSVPKSELLSWVSSGLIEWPGHVQVFEWICKSTCLLLPTFYREGSPRSIQECLAIGRPVISTSIPSVSSILEHGFTGFLADPFDTDAFALYVQELISSPSLWISCCSNARSYAIANFDSSSISTRMYDLMMRS